MSMFVTTVADALVGMSYTSSTRGKGIIQEAVRRNDVWDSFESEYLPAYAVRVRPTFDGVPVADFWSTLVVRP